MTGYRSLSLWHDTAGEDFEPRPSLPGPADVDVAIVGAGYTGLWTAYYLKKADPGLRVIVLEKEVAGFGASGRNGGWCSNQFATPRERMTGEAGRGRTQALLRAMNETVSEVERVVVAEGIDCHFYRGGNLTFATGRAQLEALRERVAYEDSWGFGADDYRWLSPDEACRRIAVDGALGAVDSPHSARVHPARLARGLARAVEALGVPVYERTPALRLGAGSVVTPGGSVKAEVIVRATESFTVALPGLRRTLIPLYSLMIATEPLPPATWERIGWHGAETWKDGRHLLIYLSRTADGRIAIGGRGAPYHFGSRIDPACEQDPRVFAMLQRTLGALLPPVRTAEITHRWGGAVGLTRDWHTSVGFDKRAGMAWAGGYVGNGVATANLAGRTLADLITGVDSPLTHLPWVDHVSPPWEREPLRWLGVNLAIKAMASADRIEERTGRPAKRAGLTERLVGR